MGQGEPIASAAFYRAFVLTPTEALDAAKAVTVNHHGLIKAPYFLQWANELLHHMPGFNWDKLARDLTEAALAADEDLEMVQVSVMGSIRPKYFHLLVLTEAVPF